MSGGPHRSGKRTRRRSAEAAGPLRRPSSSYGDRSLDVVYVAVEGHRTEFDYLRKLAETYGQPEGENTAGAFQLKLARPGKNGARPAEVVELVLARATGPDDEKWALFDRDSGDNRDKEIPEAIRTAAANGVQTALSHPSFELWLLLHFQQFTSRENGLDGGVKKLLRKHPDAKGFERYDTASGDRGKGIDDRRWAALRPKIGDAVRHARQLVGQCPQGACSPHAARITDLTAGGGDQSEGAHCTGHAAECDPLLRDPSSDVWRLLARLGIGDDSVGRSASPGAGEGGRKGRRKS